jgi:hypothetical protein
MPYFVEV